MSDEVQVTFRLTRQDVEALERAADAAKDRADQWVDPLPDETLDGDDAAMLRSSLRADAAALKRVATEARERLRLSEFRKGDLVRVPADATDESLPWEFAGRATDAVIVRALHGGTGLAAVQCLDLDGRPKTYVDLKCLILLERA